MLGLPRGEVFLVPWTDAWFEEFKKEKERIHHQIGDYIVNIHHIGSTAVRGLRAKPIIDIAIELEDFNDGKECVDSLQSLNYTYGGTNVLPDRHYFSKGEPRTHQIHMYKTGNQRSEEHTSELQSRGQLVCRLLLD